MHRLRGRHRRSSDALLPALLRRALLRRRVLGTLQGRPEGPPSVAGSRQRPRGIHGYAPRGQTAATRREIALTRPERPIWGRRQGLLVARADDRCAERVCDASLAAQRRGPLRMDDASYSGAKARAGPRGERVRAKVHLESPPVHQSRPCRRAFKMQSLPPYSPPVLVRL